MYKYLKISTLVLLFWYVGLRGILLAMSNESSIDWMKNPIGTSIALCSLVYLGFAYAFLPTKKPTYFILATMGLFLANLYCLEEMTKLTGTSIALCSLVYLGFAYAFLSTKKPTYFILATMGLFLANLYCLEEMTKLFIHDFTLINFAYFLLDCYILSYYSVMWRYCCMTSDNKILCPFANVRIVE